MKSRDVVRRARPADDVATPAVAVTGPSPQSTANPRYRNTAAQSGQWTA
jgi:hypothetical protein